MSDSPSVASELKRLIKQSSQYLTAMVVNLGLGFVSFPILTRVFSVADFGIIDLVQKVFLLLTATSKLGQQHSALRFFNRENFEKNPEESRRYYSTMYLGVMGMGLGVTGLFALVVWALPPSTAAASITASRGIRPRLVLAPRRLPAKRRTSHAATPINARTATKANTKVSVCIR